MEFTYLLQNTLFPGVSLSIINTPCSSYSYFSPPTKAKFEAVFTPLERYLSRNSPPKDCYVWWKFATFWTFNYSSDIFNYLLQYAYSGLGISTYFIITKHTHYNYVYTTYSTQYILTRTSLV